MQVATTATHPLPEAVQPSLDAGTARRTCPDWVAEARESLPPNTSCLAYEDSGRRIIAPLSAELTRIGRSLSAEVRFDDATVSRRHAVVSCTAGVTRIFDDRSLSGVYLNGARVSSARLHDGDRIGIGRHLLWFLDGAGSAATAPPAEAPAALAG